MSSKTNETSRTSVSASVLAAASLTVLALHIGFAASLPLSSTDLFGQMGFDTPDLVVDDNFTGRENLNNRVPPTVPAGEAWRVNDGRFRVRNGVAESRNNPPSRATVGTGLSDEFTVHTQIVQLGTADRVGLAFLAQGPSYLYAVYNRITDRAEIHASSSGILASSGTLGGPGTLAFSVQVAQPTITVMVGGVPVVSHTMSAAEVASYGSNMRAGLIADSNRAMFEYFTVVET
jgi:hypothetical protein